MIPSPTPPFVVFSDVLDIYDDVEGFRGHEDFGSLEAFDSLGRRIHPDWHDETFRLPDLFKWQGPPAIDLRLGEVATDRLRQRLLDYLENDAFRDAPLEELIAAARPPT